MPITIRLKRGGAKKRPFYHLVVTDSRSPRDSNFIEKIGTYNPRKGNESGITINEERAAAWMKNGAQMSDRVKVLFSKTDLKKCL